MLRKVTTGKNIPLFYYLRNLIRFITPKTISRLYSKSLLTNLEKRDDYQYIIDRVNYYNKLSEKCELSDKRICIKDLGIKNFKKYKSKYFFDTYQHIRIFNKNLQFDHIFGDVTRVPSSPNILKSRPIYGDIENSVLLNLDKQRHFVFLKDRVPFKEKMNRSICLSYSYKKPHREDFLRKHICSPLCEAGDVQKHPATPKEWYHDKVSLWEHLKYKFVVTLEGNDVATNLKWVMSSNCVAIMPRPRFETWFMEGTLIANYHYIEIKADYSDFEDRLKYYIEHCDEAEAIVKNANEYIEQFRNKKRERIISHLVLKKYFDMTN